MLKISSALAYKTRAMYFWNLRSPPLSLPITYLSMHSSPLFLLPYLHIVSHIVMSKQWFPFLCYVGNCSLEEGILVLLLWAPTRFLHWQWFPSCWNHFSSLFVPSTRDFESSNAFSSCNRSLCWEHGAPSLSNSNICESWMFINHTLILYIVAINSWVFQVSVSLFVIVTCAISFSSCI